MACAAVTALSSLDTAIVARDRRAKVSILFARACVTRDATARNIGARVRG